QVFGCQLLALPDCHKTSLQGCGCLLKQPALPLPGNQAAFRRAKEVVSEPDEGIDQPRKPIAPRRRDPELRYCRPLAPSRGTQVDFVAHRPDRHVALMSDLPIISVGEPQHQIRACRTRTRTPYAFLLDGIIGIA